jgi:hypothetical protein
MTKYEVVFTHIRWQDEEGNRHINDKGDVVEDMPTDVFERMDELGAVKEPGDDEAVAETVVEEESAPAVRSARSTTKR